MKLLPTCRAVCSLLRIADSIVCGA